MEETKISYSEMEKSMSYVNAYSSARFDSMNMENAKKSALLERMVNFSKMLEDEKLEKEFSHIMALLGEVLRMPE